VGGSGSSEAGCGTGASQRATALRSLTHPPQLCAASPPFPTTTTTPPALPGTTAKMANAANAANAASRLFFAAIQCCPCCKGPHTGTDEVCMSGCGKNKLSP
jgi:hypothetical protein